MHDEDLSSCPVPEADTSAGKSTSNTPPPSQDQAQNPRRKRGHGIVTAHACRECRRKRAKVGRMAHRCESHDRIECVYEARLRQSKAELRAQLRQLRRREDATRHVMAALRQAEAAEQVVARLWAGHSVQDVSRWLGESGRGGASGRRRLSSPAPRPAGPASSPSPSPSPSPHRIHAAPACRDRRSVLWPSGEPTCRIRHTWTRITSDADLVEHLLALYFCWEYPTFASLSREHYLRDFIAGSDTYCSALLTNALLALASRLSSRPEVRAGDDDAVPAGEHFFGECKRLYDAHETDQYRLTTVQALGIMAIREVSCGHISSSEYYAGQCMRLALEMGLHQVHSLDTGDEEDVRHRTVKLATFWGAFALNNTSKHRGNKAVIHLQRSILRRLPPKNILDAIPTHQTPDDRIPRGASLDPLQR
ncbi:hypothetical protein E4U21_003065 [Claviceps maximensis]|nr:hypothetical protein E4U21_003065 [Claviceps maximensis]